MPTKQLLIQMTSQNTQTFDLQEAIFWKSVTLERCNLVTANNTENTYIIHIDQMPSELLVCTNGTTSNRTGTFFVGEPPFNPQEDLTVHNTNPGKPINHLSIKIYTTSGQLATGLTNSFYIKLKINKI